VRLRTQVILTSISKSLKHVSVFIIAIFLTRYFTKDEYGTYIQVMMIMDVALYLALFGIPSSVYYFLPRAAEKKRLMKNTMLLLFSVAVLVSAIIYQFIEQLATGLNNLELVPLGWLIASFILLQIPIKLYEPFMICTQNVARFVAVNATFNLAFLFAVVTPLLLGWSLAELLLVLFYFFLAQFLAIYIVTGYTYFQLKDDVTGEEYRVAEQISYSAPIGFSGAIAQLGKIVDKVIVSGYFNPATLAVYARGAMEIPMLNVIANSLGNILMPKFVEEFRAGNNAAVLKLWHSSIKMMAMFIYPTLVFLILNGSNIIPFLFTEEYLASVIIFQIYTLGLVTRITSYDSIVRTVGKTKILLKMSVFAVVLNVVLTIVLINAMGIVGAPLATVIVGTILRFIYLVIITKLLEVSLFNVFPWMSLLKLIVSALLAGACILPILSIGLSYLMAILVSGAVFSIVYLIVFRILKPLDKSELKSVKGLIPKPLRWVL